MKFLPWLFDQLDEPTPVGDFANLCWKDVNNGCASTKYGPTQWREHFETKHKAQANLLVSLLTKAYAQYVLSISAK